MRRFGPWRVGNIADVNQALRDLEGILEDKQSGWTTSGTTTKRTLSNTATLADVINVLGTLIEDLKAKRGIKE